MIDKRTWGLFSLTEAYMLVGIQKYSQKSKLRTVKEKVYTVDVAMIDQRDNAFAGDNLGHRLETIVAIHLHRPCKLSHLDVYYPERTPWRM